MEPQRGGNFSGANSPWFNQQENEESNIHVRSPTSTTSTSPQPQLPHLPPIQYKAPNVIVIEDQEEKMINELENLKVEMESSGNSKPGPNFKTHRKSRTPETMMQLIDTTPEASDNDEVSNNDEVIEDSNDVGEAENGHHKSDPDGSEEDADRSVGSTCTQEKETVLATAIAGNKKVSTSYPANKLNDI